MKLGDSVRSDSRKRQNVNKKFYWFSRQVEANSGIKQQFQAINEVLKSIKVTGTLESIKNYFLKY